MPAISPDASVLSFTVTNTDDVYINPSLSGKVIKLSWSTANATSVQLTTGCSDVNQVLITDASNNLPFDCNLIGISRNFLPNNTLYLRVANFRETDTFLNFTLAPMKCDTCTASANRSYKSISIPPITPSIRVISPNGGEQWQIGSTQTLKWSSGNVHRVTFDLVDSANKLVVKNISSFATDPIPVGDQKSVSWTIPSYVQEGQYRLRAGTCPSYVVNCNTKDNQEDPVTIYDYSDAPFSIVAAGMSQTPSGQYTASILENIKSNLDRIQKEIDNLHR